PASIGARIIAPGLWLNYGMKLIKLLVICVFAAASSFAGVSYDFHSETTGMQQTTIDGKVASDGVNMRMSMSHGDGLLFKDGAMVLARNGGKTFAVYDPAAKTFFELGIEDLAANAASMLNNPMIKVTFKDPVVNLKDAGEGGTLEGFPTEKSELDATIEMSID